MGNMRLDIDNDIIFKEINTGDLIDELISRFDEVVIKDLLFSCSLEEKLVLLQNLMQDDELLKYLRGNV